MSHIFTETEKVLSSNDSTNLITKNFRSMYKYHSFVYYFTFDIYILFVILCVCCLYDYEFIMLGLMRMESYKILGVNEGSTVHTILNRYEREVFF